MKIAKYIIAIMFVMFISIPVLAEGYSILVIPNGCVGTVKDRNVGNIDIEELLARKIIDKLEFTGMAYAPTLQVLKISIKNNPNVKPNTVGITDNAKTLSSAYGVPKVLLISSKTEYKSVGQQKNFWNRLELPVLIQHESDIRLVTTVTLLNAKDNEVIWSDVYYKDINLIGEGINNYNTNGAKLSAINNYYDELIPKIFNNIKDTKETHAIMVNEKNLPDNSKEAKSITKDRKTISFEKYKENLHNMFNKKEKKVIAAKPEETKITPNVTTKKEVSSKKTKTTFTKFKKVAHLKNTGIEKTALKTENDKKQAPKQVKQNAPVQKATHEVTNKKKTVQETKKENRTKQTKVEKPSKLSQIKTAFDNKLKNYKQKRAEARVEKLQKQAEKIISSNSKKEKKPSFSERIKTKYNGFKSKNIAKKEEKQRQKEENIKYSTMIRPNDENTSEATKALQTKPRNNARNFTPKYDNSINDI